MSEITLYEPKSIAITNPKSMDWLQEQLTLVEAVLAARANTAIDKELNRLSRFKQHLKQAMKDLLDETRHSNITVTKVNTSGVKIFC